MKDQPKKLWIALAVWVIGILIPMAWLVSNEAGVNAIFNSVFESEWTHIVVHMFLYAVLGGLIAWLFIGRIKLWILIPACVILVGILQETMQLIPLNRAPGLPELFDLGVDLTGGLIGWLVFCIFFRLLRHRTPAMVSAEEVKEDEE